MSKKDSNQAEKRFEADGITADKKLTDAAASLHDLIAAAREKEAAADDV